MWFRWLGCLSDVFFFDYAERCFELFKLHGSLGLFVLGILAAFRGSWGFWDEPESLILAQSERWRHA
jgi:cytochrome b561